MLDGFGMFSVCVPVFNEEENIERITDNIRSSDLWKQSKKKELLFCINGSSDHSESIARRLAVMDPHIRVLVTKKKGKNNAWMKLVKNSASSSNTLFFVDADVAIEPSVFSKLQQELDKAPRLAIAGAFAEPFPEKGFFNFRRKVWRRDFRDAGEAQATQLSGGCYAIRRNEAVKVRMPSDQRIAEDVFLGLWFTGRMKKLADAKMFFRLPKYWDTVSQRTRFFATVQLIQQQYPELAQKLEGYLKEPLRRPILRRIARPSRFIALGLNRTATLLARRRARAAVKKGTDTWPKLKTTKRIPKH